MLRRQEQIQRSLDERQREQETEFRRRNEASTPRPELAPLPEEPVSPGAPCMDVEAIDVEGVTLLPSRVVRRVTERYSHRCLSMADINNLLRDMTNAYIERGYVTAQVLCGQTNKMPGAWACSPWKVFWKKLWCATAGPATSTDCERPFPVWRENRSICGTSNRGLIN